MQTYRGTQAGRSPSMFTPLTGGAAAYTAPRSERQVPGGRIRLNQDSRSRWRTSTGGAAGARSAVRAVAASPAQAAQGNGRNGRRQAGASRIGARASRATDFMRYANDNAFVRAVYSFVTGPTKPLFYGIVALVVFLGIYFPVREYYIACRMDGIYSQQLEQHQTYNEELQADVDKLMTREGIADEAHERFGYVMPGETSGEVVGLDEDGSPVQQESGDEAPADDGDAAADGSADESEKAVTATSGELDEVDGPWYAPVLDTLFFFTGENGQTVASTGSAS